MKLKNVRDFLDIRKNEIVINKKLNIRGKEVVILSLIKGEECNKLWIIHKEERIKIDNEEYEDIISTNREELINNIKESRNSEYISFKEITIQDKKVTFESSSSSSFEYCEYENILMLNYFINRGMIPNEWDDVNLDNIVVTTCVQMIDEEFPNINNSEKLNIKLVLDEGSREVLIQKPFTIEIKKYDKNNKIEYIDDESEERKFFYLNEVKKYDIWKDYLDKLEENLKYIPQEQKEEYKANYIDSLECECPKDMNLLIIYYEDRDNEQLRFMTKEYLNSQPYCDGGACGMIFLFEKNEGINGYRQNIEEIKPVPKDFDEILEVELFSKYVNIPSETISFEVWL